VNAHYKTNVDGGNNMKDQMNNTTRRRICKFCKI